jgi:hypothetical protein
MVLASREITLSGNPQKITDSALFGYSHTKLLNLS